MTLQADLCTTLIDEWVRAGLRDAVIAPGSRSSLLALALLNDDRVRVHVRLDERSAAFVGLGIALGTGVPVLVVTTSGTAATEVHAAVAEADLACVPLIICTADRPVELHDVGAPQTIDQVGIYAGATRYATMITAEEITRPHWRSFASRVIAEATASVAGPGPVHCNVQLREPFSTDPGTATPGRSDGAPWHRVLRAAGPSLEVLEAFFRALGTARRGLIVAGGSPEPEDPDAVLALADALGWPVLAEPRALPRVAHPLLIAHGDAIVRSNYAAAELTPDCIIQLGAPHASKVLGNYLERLGAKGTPRILVDPYGRFPDPDRQATLVLGVSTGPFCRAVAAPLTERASVAPDPDWAETWHRADIAADSAISIFLEDRSELDEPFVARTLFSNLPEDAVLFASSSMPVRDLEWYTAPRYAPPRVFSNRGANGIDGVTSTALGLATALGDEGKVAALVGDLAFFYDLSGLLRGAHEREVDLTMVVVDNGGGGIFSFLDYAPTLSPRTFERAFGTPQGANAATVARSLGARVEEIRSKEELEPAIVRALAHNGLDVIVVRTSRAANVGVHADLARAAVLAIETSLSQ